MRDRYLFVLIGLLLLSLFSFFFQLFFLAGEPKPAEFTLSVKQEEETIPQKLEGVSKSTETQNEIDGLLEEIEKKEADIKNLSDEIINLKNLPQRSGFSKKERAQKDEIDRKSLEIQTLQADLDRISKEKERVVFLQSEKVASGEEMERVKKEKDEYLERTKETERELEKNKAEIERLKKEIDTDKIALSELKSQLQAQTKDEEKTTKLSKDIAEAEEREKALQEKSLALQSEKAALTQKNLEFSAEKERSIAEKRILDEERVLAKEKNENLLTDTNMLVWKAIKEAEEMLSELTNEERREPEEMLLLAKEAYSKKDYDEAFKQAAKSCQKSYYTKASKEEKEKISKAGFAGTLLNILLLWR